MKAEELLIFSGLIISVFFISYFLLFRRIERGGRKYIIAGMVLATYIFLYDFLTINGYYNFSVWFYLFYFPVIFSFYPIIYHYLIYITDDKNSRIIIRVFSFSPVIVFLLVAAFYLPLDYQSKIEFITADIISFEGRSKNYEIYQLSLHLLYYIQLLIFITIFVQLYLIQKKRRKLATKNALFLPSWLFTFITVIILYEIIYLILVISNSPTYGKVIEAIANLMVLSLVGFLGIYHDAMVISMKLKFGQGQSISEPRISKKGTIDSENASSVMNEIYLLIKEQKLDENPGLKLEHIAKKLHLPEKKLSVIINQETGNNFPLYLNKIRITKAKKLLLNQEEKQKIEDVYLKTGYYTRSTFNRAFKSIEGKTPTEFINSNL